MDSFIQLMLWPFLACLVLVVMHAYLGLHVLRRNVVFVDLALAQMAALGGILSQIFGGESSYFSLLLTGVGALVLAMMRGALPKEVPYESFVGILYAVSLSLALLLSAKLPHGADELKEMFSGNILWVDKNQWVHAFVLYFLIGLVVLFFHKKILSQSSKTIDFAFYACFGVVVTSSVQMAGVLLVFALLVIPAGIALLLSVGFARQLLLACAVGWLACALGMYASYAWDLSTGPCVVVALGILWMIGFLSKKIID